MPPGLSGHMFRGELVKVHGDWKSNAYFKFLEFSLDQRLVVAQAMAEGLY